MNEPNLLKSFFLDKLYHNKSLNHNPFISSSKPQIKNENIYFSPFGFYEDLLPKEVRCPICLGRTSKASKPDCCFHTFCNFCLKKWHKSSSKCPICRRYFQEIQPVDINDSKISQQMDLYV